MSITVARPYPPRLSRFLAVAGLGLLAAMAMLLASCGGGVGTGGTGSFSGAGSYSMAPVSGFGSIFVGGVEFDDARAAILDDDGGALAGGRAAIRLGMVVEVQGGEVTPGPVAPAAVASKVQLARLVVGTVASVDNAAGRLTVLGQALQTNSSTVFDPALQRGLAGLRVGDTVSAHALPDAAGNAVATRIEPADPGETWRLRGFAAAVDAQARRFTVGSATLDYASAANLPPDLASGQFVHVKIARNPSAGVLRVASFVPATTAPGDAASVTTEGVLTAPGNGGLLRIGALNLDVRGATVVPASSVLLPGMQVLVQGRLDGGTLVADTVTVTPSEASERRTYQLVGSLTGLDEAAETFVVRDVTVDYSAARFVNGTVASLSAPEATVHVQGTLSADRTFLQARMVVFR
jgi:hypothetical protein